MKLHHGDCLEVLPRFKKNHFDSCVTDPPYHFQSIIKRFGKKSSAPAKSNGETGIYKRVSKGFLGNEWDGGSIAFEPSTWRKVYRVLKPGAHLVAFGAPRNFHQLVTAIEKAGFEIRDTLYWFFLTGFPKAYDTAQQIEKKLTTGIERRPNRKLGGITVDRFSGHAFKQGAIADTGGQIELTLPEAIEWKGWASALKPCYEPIVLARKPLIGSIAENVLKYGTGSLNVDACRLPDGSWPGNVLHDGCLRYFLDTKADKDERIGSDHPTVKPLALMRWLVRLTTRKSGKVLDPFAGTGITAEAAYYEGMKSVLVEMEEKYLKDIKRRMDVLGRGPFRRLAEIAAAKPADQGPLFG